MSRRGSGPRMPCPVCHRPTAVTRSTERLREHKAGGERCPGSGVVVHLYSDPPEMA